MKPFRITALLLWILILGPGSGLAIVAEIDPRLDGLKNRMFYENEDGSFYLEAGLQVDLWGYYRDDNGGPTGFWFPKPGRDWDWSQRLTFTLDAFFGENLYGFAKIRWDDGVHPGVGQFYGDHTEVRFDEVFLRYTASSALNIQIGQFTPLFGGFLSRQNSWDMGLVSYPTPYENVTTVSDNFPPGDAFEFTSGRLLPDNKLWQIPIVWAPLYTLGASVFGSVDNWGYAINITNSAPSSRGLVWNDIQFDTPTVLGRLEYRFGPDFSLAGNFSHGSYIRHFLGDRLPAGTGINDFRQTVWSLDAKWAYRDFQVWAEALYNIFDVPNVGDDAAVFSYFVEGRWDFSPRWWAALRWNQERYNRVNADPGGPGLRWDNPLYRVDIGVGCRFSRHAQFKLQYSYQDQDAAFQNGRHLILSEFTFRL